MALWKVTDRLYTGPFFGPQERLQARQAGITHVINVAQELPDGITPVGSVSPLPHHLKIATLDDHRPKTAIWFAPLLRTTLQIMDDPTTKILFHCEAGHHRSPSAAYLILRAFGLPSPDAAARVYGRIVPRYGADADKFLQNLPTAPPFSSAT